MKATEHAVSRESKLTLSWRISLPQWETDDAFAKLLALLNEHESVVDEVRCLAPGRPCTALPAEPVADGHLVALRNIEPWDMRMVLVDTTS